MQLLDLKMQEIYLIIHVEVDDTSKKKRPRMLGDAGKRPHLWRG